MKRWAGILLVLVSGCGTPAPVQRGGSMDGGAPGAPADLATVGDQLGGGQGADLGGGPDLACHGSSCSCVPESDTGFCTRLRKNCGSVSGVDNCGAARTASCGSCSGKQTCGGMGSDNVCGCSSESDGAFCARLGKSCGSVTDVDNCGHTRTVASCGDCAPPQSCGVSGVCGCQAESDKTFCTRLGKNCGSVTAPDNCGASRTVNNCGNCASPQSCGGAGIANVCGCQGESDVTFCASYGKNCGTVSGVDNCRIARTVASCGDCSAPQSCGGSGTSNVCGCTPEGDGAFCVRLGKNCGSVSALDNCGAPRTTDCGGCSGKQTCGGSGTDNVCGCTGESDGAFCARLGKACGTVTGTDSCGLSRTVASCGSCADPQTCGGDGRANVCALPIVQTWAWDYPTPTGEPLATVWPVAADDVWAVGAHGAIVHWDGKQLRSVAGPTNQDLLSLWGSSASDIWAGGRNDALLHWDGKSWNAVSAGGVNDVFYDMWGSGPNDIWIDDSNFSFLHWDGAQWSKIASPLYNVFGVGGWDQSHVWAVGGLHDFETNVQLASFNGLSWNTTVLVNQILGITLYAVFMPSADEAWAVGSASSPSYGVIMHWTASGGWTAGANPAGVNVDWGVHIWGSSAKDLWVTSDNQHCIFQGDGTRWSCRNPGFMPRDARGSAANNVWTVGEEGQVARSSGAEFSALTAPPVHCTQPVGVGTSDFFANCTEGILHWSSGFYSLIPVTLAAGDGINAIWAVTATSLWAVTRKGNVLNWDGANWHTVKSYSGTNLAAVWADSDDDVWIAANQALLHLQGGTWTPTAVGFNASAFWGSGPHDVWAAANNAVEHYDGSSWSSVTLPAGYGGVVAVSGSAANNVWFASSSGALHWDGSKLAPSSSPALQTIWASGPNDVYALGNYSAYYYNGASWTTLTVPSSSGYFGGLWGDGARDVFLVGYGVVRSR